MTTTRKTLLHRVRDGQDQRAWSEFFALYAPVLEGYARARGLRGADAEEIRDQCLAVVVERMPAFEYERARGTFKGWLHGIARGKVVDWLRRPGVAQPATGVLTRIPSRDGEPDADWERSWRSEHVRQAVILAKRNEDETGRLVFDLLLEDDVPVEEIARRTGLNANQVYKARARLLRRLREALAKLGEQVESF